MSILDSSLFVIFVNYLNNVVNLRSLQNDHINLIVNNIITINNNIINHYFVEQNIFCFSVPNKLILQLAQKLAGANPKRTKGPCAQVYLKYQPKANKQICRIIP